MTWVPILKTHPKSDTMSLRHAILGILAYQPMHGYQLKTVLELGVAAFWPVNLAAIYPSLRQLESEGLVSHREEASAEGRPNRKVYTITGDGREELARWRREPPAEVIPRVKSPLFLKLLFAQEENLPDVIGWIENEIEASEAAAGFLQSQLGDAHAFSTIFFVNFMRQHGIEHLNLHARGLRELKERIQKGIEKRAQRAASELEELLDESERGPGSGPAKEV